MLKNKGVRVIGKHPFQHHFWCHSWKTVFGATDGKSNEVLFRPLFFENLFNEPADSRFPKIRIKIKIGFRVFLFAPIRNFSPHFILCDAFANGGQWTW